MSQHYWNLCLYMLTNAEVCFDLVSLFNSIKTFVGYLMPKLSL